MAERERGLCETSYRRFCFSDHLLLEYQKMNGMIKHEQMKRFSTEDDEVFSYLRQPY